MADQTKPEDYLAFLQQLDQAGQPYFLEGGQAVNFWAEYFSTREAGGALRDFQPFTSKDCDIWVDASVLRYLAENRRGALVRGTSPADGQLGVPLSQLKPVGEVDENARLLSRFRAKAIPEEVFR